MADNRRLIFELDVDSVKFDKGMTEAAKRVKALNASQLKAYEKTLGVLQKITLQHELATKAGKGSTDQLIKAVQQLQKTTNPPRKKPEDPLGPKAGKKAVAAIKKTEKAYLKFTKQSKKNVEALADEVIRLSKEGRELEGPQQYIEALGKAEEATTALKLETSELKKENKALLKQGDELGSKDRKRLEENTKLIAKNEKATRNLGKATRGIRKDFDVFERAEGDAKKLKAEIERLTRQFDAMGEAGQQSAEGIQLGDKIKDLNEQLNANRKSIGEFYENIGNYTESIKEAIAETGAFGETTVQAISRIRDGAQLLFDSPIFAIGTALAAAGALLVKAYSQTAKGAENLRKANRQVRASLRATWLLGVNAVGEYVDSLDDVQDGQTEVKKFSLFAAIKAFGQTKEAASQLAFELEKIAELQDNLRLEEALNAGELAEYNAELERLDSLAGNARNSIETRTALELEASRQRTKIADKERDLVRKRVDILNREIIALNKNGADVRELQIQRFELGAELIEKESASEQARLDFRIKLGELEQEAVLAEVDRLEEIGDAKFIANEKIAARENSTLEERQTALTENTAFIRKNFRDQIAAYQRLTDKTVDFNQIIAEKDAERAIALAQSFGFSEDVLDQFITKVREAQEKVSDLADQQSDLNEKYREREKIGKEAGQTVVDLTIKTELSRLQTLRDSQKTETKILRLGLEQQTTEIGKSYEALRQKATDELRTGLFPREKFDDYIAALDLLEKKAKDAARLAIESEVLEVNQTALENALSSLARTTEATIDKEVDRATANQIKDLTEAYDKGEISYKEYQKRLTRISANAGKKRAEAELKSLEDQLREIGERISATEGKNNGLKTFDPEKILSDEDLAEAKDRAEKLRTAIAEASAGIATGGITKPEDEAEDPLADYIGLYQQIEEVAVSAWNRIAEAQIAAADRALDVQRDRIETAKEFFRKGNETYLAQEEERQRELEQRREKAVRRQQAIDKASQISSVLTGLLSEFASGGITKAGAALAGISALVAIVGNLIPAPQNFYKGTRFVEGPEGIDNVPANLTRGERVTTAKQNKEFGKVYDFLEAGNIAPKEAMERLTVPRFNYGRLGESVTNHTNTTDTKALEAKVGQMIQQQKETREAISAMQMSVSLDREGFAAYQKKFADRVDAQNL